MPKEAVFTMTLEPELRDAFLAEAQAVDRPASQILRELMRGYVAERRAARDYDSHLACKVELGRADFRVGRARSHEDVEAAFTVRRAALHKV
jgi:predicted transcriptional regulator